MEQEEPSKGTELGFWPFVSLADEIEAFVSILEI